jgi:hypothetical protein
MSRTILSNAKTTTVVSDGPVAHIPVQAGAEDAPEALDPEQMDDIDPDEDEEDEDDDEYDDEQPAAGLGLDDDPDTSLVGSIYLHMLSEHNCYGALRLSDDDAIALHQQLHKDQGQDHGIADWRFRPGRALAASMLSADTPNPPPA